MSSNKNNKSNKNRNKNKNRKRIIELYNDRERKGHRMDRSNLLIKDLKFNNEIDISKEFKILITLIEKLEMYNNKTPNGIKKNKDLNMDFNIEKENNLKSYTCQTKKDIELSLKKLSLKDEENTDDSLKGGFVYDDGGNTFSNEGSKDLTLELNKPVINLTKNDLTEGESVDSVKINLICEDEKESMIKESTMKESMIKESMMKESMIKESMMKESTIKESTIKESMKGSIIIPIKKTTFLEETELDDFCDDTIVVNEETVFNEECVSNEEEEVGNCSINPNISLSLSNECFDNDNLSKDENGIRNENENSVGVYMTPILEMVKEIFNVITDIKKTKNTEKDIIENSYSLLKLRDYEALNNLLFTHTTISSSSSDENNYIGNNNNNNNHIGSNNNHISNNNNHISNNVGSNEKTSPEVNLKILNICLSYLPKIKTESLNIKKKIELLKTLIQTTFDYFISFKNMSIEIQKSIDSEKNKNEERNNQLLLESNLLKENITKLILKHSKKVEPNYDNGNHDNRNCGNHDNGNCGNVNYDNRNCGNHDNRNCGNVNYDEKIEIILSNKIENENSFIGLETDLVEKCNNILEEKNIKIKELTKIKEILSIKLNDAKEFYKKNNNDFLRSEIIQLTKNKKKLQNENLNITKDLQILTEKCFNYKQTLVTYSTEIKRLRKKNRLQHETIIKQKDLIEIFQKNFIKNNRSNSNQNDLIDQKLGNSNGNNK